MPLEDSDTTDFQITCPFCGEEVEIYIESDVIGTLVMDCQVCCQPWQVHVTRDDDDRYVDVMRGDGS
jgi:transcription elongation factor Elf1